MMMACYCSWVEKRISIRQGGFVYVDKTGLVYRLAQDGNGENILIEEYNRNILKGFYSAFKAAARLALRAADRSDKVLAG